MQKLLFGGETPLPTGQGVELHKEQIGGFPPLFVDPDLHIGAFALGETDLLCVYN